MWERLNRIAIIAALLTFGFNGGTSISCFGGGVFCEYALIGPSRDGVLAEHQRQLAASTNALVLTAQDTDVLFGNGRVDLYADQHVVASFDRGTALNYQIGPGGAWAAFFEPKDSKAHYSKYFQLTLFDSSAGLAKSVVVLECSNFDEEPEIAFLNTRYASKLRDLSFDVVSNCTYLKVNDVHYVRFGTRQTSGRAGLHFNSELQLINVVAVDVDGAPSAPAKILYDDKTIQAAHSAGESKRDACVEDFLRATKDFEFKECKARWELAYHPEDTGRTDYIYFGAVARKAGVVSIVKAECLVDDLEVSRRGPDIFAACKRNFGGDYVHSYATITGSNGAGRIFEVEFTCACYGFDIRGLKFRDANTVQFELLANAETIRMDSFDVALTGGKPRIDSGAGMPRGVYEISLSEAGVALALKPSAPL